MALYITVNPGEVYDNLNSLEYCLAISRDASKDDRISTGGSFLLETHYRYETPFAVHYGYNGRIVGGGHRIYYHYNEDKFAVEKQGPNPNVLSAHHISFALDEVEPSSGPGFGAVWENRVAWTLSGEVGIGVPIIAFLRAAEAIHIPKFATASLNIAVWNTYYNSHNWNFKGAENNDVFTGGALGDTIRGGSGQDALAGAGGSDFIYGENDGDILSGGDGNDQLRGGSGADLLIGGNDNDTLIGGTGADILQGDNGSDTASYIDSLLIGVTARLDQSRLNKGDALGDTYFSVENLSGSNFADTLVGDSIANTLRGQNGSDALYGYDGHDLLFGGADADKLYGHNGDDILTGGTGADQLVGSVGEDTASYYFGNTTGGVTASLADSSVNTGEALGDTYSSIENLEGSSFSDILIGNSLANELFGVNGADALFGNAGSDGLYGGSGTDFLEGGSGADFLSGGAEFDFATYTFAADGVTANLNNRLLNTGDAADDEYDSIEGLGGSAFEDTLTGNSSGNVINGGLGSDTLTGGAGQDAFVFSTALNATTNKDTITDFSVIDDVMWLENTGIFAKLTAAGALNAAYFRTGTVALDSNDYIVYNLATGDLFYDADGNGAGAAVKFAHVNPNTALTAADFLVV